MYDTYIVINNYTNNLCFIYGRLMIWPESALAQFTWHVLVYTGCQIFFSLSNSRQICSFTSFNPDKGTKVVSLDHVNQIICQCCFCFYRWPVQARKGLATFCVASILIKLRRVKFRHFLLIEWIILHFSLSKSYSVDMFRLYCKYTCFEVNILLGRLTL